MDPKDVADQNTNLVSTTKRTARLVALFVSLYSLLAACAGLLGSRCTTRGMVAKNEAVYYQGLSTNEWAFFQSRNIRKEINSLNPRLNKTELERFQNQADTSYAKAKSLEVERDKWNDVSKSYLDVSKTFGSALAFLQVAVILVSLTIIVETFSVFAFANVLGLFGSGFLVYAFYEYWLLVSAI